MSQINLYFYISIFCFLSVLLIFYAKSKDDDEESITLNRQFYESFKSIQPFNEKLKNESYIDKIINSSSDAEIRIKPSEQKYIGCNFYETDGIGYQLWRFASLYGIGRDTNRLPYLEGQNLQQMMNLKEIGLIFPTLLDILQIKSSPNHFIENVWFAHKECCEYEDPKSLSTLKGRYLKIKGNYLQSYRYFDNYKTEIRNIFKCGKTIEESNKDFTEKLFANDTKSFKLCAHFRRDEFLENEMLESKEDFIYPALDYALEYLKSATKIDNKISLIFIGDDYLFAKNLSIKNGFHKIYIFEPQSRGEDMCLGINYCDSLILTASGSAFGWWISYLMKENSTIFYNSKIGKNGKSKKDIYDFDIFPKEWIKLSVNKNGKAKTEEKWWREKIHF